MKTSLRDLLESKIRNYQKELYVLNEMKEDCLFMYDRLSTLKINTEIRILNEVIEDLKKILR